VVVAVAVLVVPAVHQVEPAELVLLDTLGAMVAVLALHQVQAEQVVAVLLLYY
jgi:hypothetical protein